MAGRTGRKRLRSLTQRKYRAREGRFLAEGVRVCEEAVSAGVVEELLVEVGADGTDRRLRALLERAREVGCVVRVEDRAFILGLSDTRRPQGVLAVCRRPVPPPFAPPAGPRALCLYLAGVQDPGNLGTILRSAEAFGVARVYLGPGTVDVANPKVVRATMGSVFRLPVVQAAEPASTLAAFRDAGYELLLADAGDGEGYRDAVVGPRVLLILGAEAHGARDLLPSSQGLRRLRIPMAASVESLNVAVAAAVLLAHLGAPCIRERDR